MVMYAHPFGDEMNRTRRMVALQCRQLAAAGVAVLQMDLEGCGDSDGEFDDASWRSWVDDVAHGARWLATRHDVPLVLWGLRAGALIAAEAATVLDRPVDFLFWQPVTSGKTHLQQFLRMKATGDMLAGAEASSIRALRESLAQGRHVEVAGYRLNPGLAKGLDNASLRPPPQPGRVMWLEVAAQADADLTPLSRNQVEQWRQAGWQVDVRTVPGPMFWQTVEIEEAPLLIKATMQLLGRTQPVVPA